MRTTFIEAKTIAEKMGLSEKKMYKQLVRFENIIGNQSVKDKRVLEIGAGSGVFSCLMSLAGARSVVALEPEASGSSEGVKQVFEARLARLGLENCKFIASTVQEYEEKSEKFDLIVAVASINHWDEEACMHLHEDKAAYETYISLFAKCLGFLNDNGAFILADVGRKNFFGGIKSVFGIRHPMAPTIEWHKHQQPKVWARLLKDAGLSNVTWHWTCPPPIKFGIEKLISNAIMAYFTVSYFVLTASRTSKVADGDI